MSQQIIIDYWVEKAGEDLASARDNLKSGRFLNRSKENGKKIKKTKSDQEIEPV